MRRTGPADLAIPLVITGMVVYAILRVSYADLPELRYLASAPLAVLAVIEFALARRVRAAVRHEPDAKPMAAIVIARCVALGKASSLAGAAALGAAGALVVRVAPEADTVSAAANDLRVGLLLLAAALLLVGAGLLLEWTGIDPGSKDQDGRDGRDKAA